MYAVSQSNSSHYKESSIIRKCGGEGSSSIQYVLLINFEFWIHIWEWGCGQLWARAHAEQLQMLVLDESN